MRSGADQGERPEGIPKAEGARLAIVFNGSPLFTGDAGSGESHIRRWIIENDWLDAIVVSEQTAIADWTGARLARADKLHSTTSETVDRLVEYRSALITAAVTGKIDVRDAESRKEAAE